MRKIKLQMQLSIDGFSAGPNGEQDWMIWNMDDIVKDYIVRLTSSVDTILMGSVLYKGMAAYWPKAALDAAKSSDSSFAHLMNNMQKIVYSNTLKRADWNNSIIVNTALETHIKDLKQQPGKDIIIYGGIRIVASLIKLNLIDEYHLFINPVVLGKGLSIWNNLENNLRLKLDETTFSTCGISILKYESIPNS